MFICFFYHELALMRNIKEELNKPYWNSVYCKARTVAYAYKPIIERECIIYQIEYSNLASPIVPDMNENGKVRICRYA